MAPLPLKSLASALLTWATFVLAQSSNNGDGVRVWAAVAYVNHGDKTPWIGGEEEVLVPEGAQQLYRQGAAFRSRYLSLSSGGDFGNNSSGEAAPIKGISTDVLNNAHIDIISAQDEWVVAGALAFMQGLYPPVTGSVTDLPGGEDMGRNLAGDDTDLVDYPLEGYQYPMVQTRAWHDSESPSVQGTVGCTKWISQTGTPFRESEDMREIFNNTRNFYQEVLSASVFEGVINQGDGNFWNAYEIYEWVKYMYNHNETVFEGLDNGNDTLAELETNALALARAKLTRPNTSSSDGDDDTIATVAGRTLARRIIDQLRRSISSHGSQEKLSLMFGSYEPMLSFLSIAGLLDRENLLSGPFSRFPDQGAAFVIELISDASDNDSSSDLIPDDEELRIRFYYRENTDSDTPFELFSLLNSGLGGQSIPYESFVREMTEKGLSTEAWCDTCDAQQAPFCPSAMDLDSLCSSSSNNSTGSDSNGMYGPDSGRMHPVLAGFIGSLVLAGVLGIIATALYVLAGFRVARVGPAERSSMVGGFKGPEKKPDDADVGVTSGGAQQERVGSWELRGGDSAPPTFDGNGAGIVNKEPSRAATREVNRYREDDEVSLVGATPVAARESF